MINKFLNFLKDNFKKKNLDHQNLMLLIGQVHAKLNLNSNSKNINDYEFKAFSQWGEDGIIDYLVSNIDIKNKTFIEFGVEHYEEANTKFLLLNKNWSGLIIDSSSDNINLIKKSELYWKYSLEVICEFITKENINNIIQSSTLKKEVGILSIDIDGNDYWVWKEINVIEPSIVIIEYNARLGKEKPYVVPYDKNFQREKKHYSMIYYGASIQALVKLGREKGYALVCCNKAGNNAFFVKKELLNATIKENSIDEVFYANKFRESRNFKGELAYLDAKKESEIILKLPLIEI
tara:strand:- start:316 stop:1191 length:876 start_codon:yes stop_codon:yes gene_type:complete